MNTVEKSTLSFLKNLSLNNNRDWFNRHKEEYMKANSNLIACVEDLMKLMNQHDVLENESAKKSLYRIYKDTRFSKDKTPYNCRLAFGFQRASKLRRGGYYVHLAPGKSFMACGFFSPNPSDLKRVRQDIDYNYKDWDKLLKLKKIKAVFGGLSGDTVLTTPRGFPADHPAIHLLRHKQFILQVTFTDQEVCSEKFIALINNNFKSARPFLDYMTQVLTTDSNGELIV